MAPSMVRPMCVGLVALGLAACAGSEAGDGVGADPADGDRVSATDNWPEPLVELADKARRRFGVPTLSVEQAVALPDGTVVVDVRTARLPVDLYSMLDTKDGRDRASRSHDSERASGASSAG